MLYKKRMAVAAAVMISAVSALALTACTNNRPKENDVAAAVETIDERPEKPVDSQPDERQSDMEFLMDNYSLTAAELDGIDLQRFIEDYDLRGLDYTAEEVHQILQDERDIYLDDGSSELFRIFEKESDDTLTADQGITKIGYYYNEGTLLRRIVFDIQEHTWYADSAEAHPLASDDIFKLLSMNDQYQIFQWESNYEGAEEDTTGSLRWKLVYEFDNGLCRSFGGYTQDMSHLPDHFNEVSTLLLGIAEDTDSM